MKRPFIYFSGCLGDARGIGQQPLPSSDFSKIVLQPLTYKQAREELIEIKEITHCFLWSVAGRPGGGTPELQLDGKQKNLPAGKTGEEDELMTFWEAQGWQEEGCWDEINYLSDHWQNPALRSCMVDSVPGGASCRSRSLELKRRRSNGRTARDEP